ncbi:ATP-dependent nuclease [Treponema sp.]|uniref:ATP-dependent nuclease n=1 Tax=Treponema sp. TaxID=166 RepID=UPI00298E530E|nr:AAA family ATPase [Treponema sp.]MCR5612878.1 AAA family ATPase [Treponema sp.]
MINVPVKIKLPFLWGKASFKKQNWSQINLVVGPNGSGKTLIAQSLAGQFADAGYSVRIFSTELVDDDEIYYTLSKNKELTQRIENVLSNMFSKTIRFDISNDGSITPIVVNKAQNLEYSMTKNECHGLKKIISLLAALYGEEDEASCLMIDEPELHLHPQFQNFFMSEIRRAAKRNPTHLFFLISHSPFFIDLKSPEELIGVVVCHINSVATSIDELSENDYSLFKRFLPRFNTYHKQFFFSDNQVFVEGYTDQAIFSSLLSAVDSEMYTATTGVIDVGGKDELGVFFKVCSLLGTNARIITDLDSLFCGKLRDGICKDHRVQQWLDKQYEKQRPFFEKILNRPEHVTFLKLVLRLEKYLLEVADSILETTMTLPHQLEEFKTRLEKFKTEREDADNLDTYKAVILQGIFNIGEYITKFALNEDSSVISNIKNLLSITLASAEAARVYVLPEGCIEHYYTQNKVLYMPVPGKDRLFHEEYDFLQSLSEEEKRRAYPELVSIIERACSKN